MAHEAVASAVMPVLGTAIGGLQACAELPNSTALLQRMQNVTLKRHLARTVVSAAAHFMPPPPCHDSLAHCRRWASSGACELSPSFMRRSCALACNFCIAADLPAQCRKRNTTSAVGPGDIGRMFERVLRAFPQYRPRALSRDPWVVELRSFLTSDEAGRLATLCRHFRPSPVGGPTEAARTHRTSQTCDCGDAACRNDPLVVRVLARLHDVTMSAPANAEALQASMRTA